MSDDDYFDECDDEDEPEQELDNSDELNHLRMELHETKQRLKSERKRIKRILLKQKVQIRSLIKTLNIIKENLLKAEEHRDLLQDTIIMVEENKRRAKRSLWQKATDFVLGR